MKIAIVTIQSVNFGNRLQNYALQSVLKRFGSVESLAREKRPFHKRVKRRLRPYLVRDSVSLFRKFDYSYIKLSPLVVSDDYVSPGVFTRYDKFVIGSDQVWNPNFSFNGDSDYLPFIESSKKVAYAASFGVDSLPGREHEIAGYLQDISSISMREQRGADLVLRISGRNVPVVLDPTLLLDVKDWSRLARKPKGLDSTGKFVFKYVLGDDINRREIDHIAGEREAIVVDATDASMRIGPREFIWLASNCCAVCTDSFHASVFALMYHKPLAIFDRSDSEVDMSSRFDTLCSIFDAERCRVRNADFDIECMDWAAFQRQLDTLRKSSLQWLEESLFGDGARG